MSQAVRDLPDPLDPSPSLATSDPDDLLAKMADEAIDRLIADADSGRPITALPPLPGVGPAAEAPESPPVEPAPDPEPNDEVEVEPAYPPAGSSTSGMVADRRIVPVEVEPARPEAIDAVAEPAADDEPAAPEHVTVEEPPAAVAGSIPSAADDHAPPPAIDRKVLLAEAPARPSLWLWPLWLLNLPFAWIGENARRVFGLIGIVTLVPAVAAIVYVLWFKHRWGG